MIRTNEQGKEVFSIDLNLDEDFVQVLKQLQERYKDEFTYMNVLSESNLNFSDFIDHFIDAPTVADVSVDANANSNTHDVCTLMDDMMKPHTKLLAFNKIFYEIKKKYGLDAATQWLDEEWSGALYMHDAASSSFKSYCFAYDLDQLVEKGLFFINKFRTAPPQHLSTFCDHTLEFISWVSNRTSGACGLPSFLVYSWYFWNKDVRNNHYLKDPEYYRRQYFQKFIYDLNQPYIRRTEAA